MEDVPGPPFRGVEWEDALDQRPAAQELIGLGHVRVVRALRIEAPAKFLTLKFLEDIHGALFGGVFPDFAGRIRGPAPMYIPRNVSVGNLTRGTHADRVPNECDELFEQLRRMILELDDRRRQQSQDQTRENALTVAAWTHCRLIEIHPFVNGNGRAVRECINYFALRYGLSYIEVGRPRDEYLSANRTWVQQRKIEHMVDYLRPFWTPLPESPDVLEP